MPTTRILDGKKVAEDIKKSLKEDVSILTARGIIPGLAVVLVGEDPASKVYVSNKEKACRELGIISKTHILPRDAEEASLHEIINSLNADPSLHGILLQLPLPKHIDSRKALELIDPAKDVDCFHPLNVGKYSIGYPFLLPCTPAGVMELLERTGISIFGKDCVMIGKSNIVGKPMAILLMNENATVAVCHSKTSNLADYCRKADIIITAAGSPGLVTGSMIKEGAVIIDVGITRAAEGRIVGDVDFESVSGIAGWVTPVPGGVGPMTIAMLMGNVIKAAKSANKIG